MKKHFPSHARSLCALSVVVALGGTTLPAWADTAGASDALTYDIPAGSLSRVLSQFAGAAGVAMSFDASRIGHAASQGLQGRYTVAQGFAELLAATDHQAVRQHNGDFVLEQRPPSSPPPVLQMAQNPPAIDREQGVAAVNGKAEIPDVDINAKALGSLTEGSGSYTTGASSSATKLDMSIRETPQSVDILTRELMDDFGLNTIEEVLTVAPGVFVEKGRTRDVFDFTSRGYEMQIQYDGVPNPFGIGEFLGTTTPDSVIFDRVDVVRGAAGLVSGAGNPGGVVNMVRKMPTTTPRASINVEGGSWNLLRLSGDVSGPISDSGKVRGRLVASYQENDSFIDYVGAKRSVIYGVVEATLSEATTLAAGINVQSRFDAIADNTYAIPYADGAGNPLDLPRSGFYGTAWSHDDQSTQMVFVKLNHALSNNWTIKSVLTHDLLQQDVLTSWTEEGNLDAATGDGLQIYPMAYAYDKQSTALDLYAAGPFTLAEREHELVVGINGSRSTMKDADWWYGDWNEPGWEFNIYDYDAAEVPHAYSTQMFNWYTYDNRETKNYGAYVTTRLDLADPLKAILGVRNSNFEYLEDEETLQKESGELTPYAGLIYDLNEWSSAYVSYAEIFEPKNISVRDTSGNTLDPTLGRNIELGMKGEFYGGRLNLYAAVYELRQEKVEDEDGPYDESNICQGQCYKEAEVTSKGFDLGVSGEVMPGLQILFGYNYVDHEYASGAQEGERFDTTNPKHNLKLATSYRWRDWTVGGNIRYQSEIFHDRDWSAEYRVTQKAYSVVGLLANYRLTKNAEIAVNIENLFDEEYWAGIDWYTSYGDPRNATVTFSYAW